MTKNRTRTPVYLDPGMHPGLEVKGLKHCIIPFIVLPVTWIWVNMLIYLYNVNQNACQWQTKNGYSTLRAHFCQYRNSAAVQRQTAVAAQFSCEQLLLFVFVPRSTPSTWNVQRYHCGPGHHINSKNNIDWLLTQRLRRWPSIKSTSV